MDDQILRTLLAKIGNWRPVASQQGNEREDVDCAARRGVQVWSKSSSVNIYLYGVERCSNPHALLNMATSVLQKESSFSSCIFSKTGRFGFLWFISLICSEIHQERARHTLVLEKQTLSKNERARVFFKNKNIDE